MTQAVGLIVADGGYGCERPARWSSPTAIGSTGTCSWLSQHQAQRLAGALTHRDYLGAILGLGSPDVLGDILVSPGAAYIICEGPWRPISAEPHPNRQEASP